MWIFLGCCLILIWNIKFFRNWVSKQNLAMTITTKQKNILQEVWQNRLPPTVMQMQTPFNRTNTASAIILRMPKLLMKPTILNWWAVWVLKKVPEKDNMLREPVFLQTIYRQWRALLKSPQGLPAEPDTISFLILEERPSLFWINTW